jgi:hypothetical protein
MNPLDQLIESLKKAQKPAYNEYEEGFQNAIKAMLNLANNIKKQNP